MRFMVRRLSRVPGLRLFFRTFSPVHVKVYRPRKCMRLLKEAGHPRVDIERYGIIEIYLTE